MTRSSPKIIKLAIVQSLVLVTICLFLFLVIELLSNWIGVNGLGLFLMAIAILAGSIVILIVLTEVNEIIVFDDKIIVRNLFTRRSKDYLFKNINAFKITTHFELSRGLRLYLILMNQRSQSEPVCLDYIDNIAEIVNALEGRLENSIEDEYRIWELKNQGPI